MPSPFVGLEVDYATAQGVDNHGHPTLLDQGWACCVTNLSATIAAHGPDVLMCGPDTTAPEAPAGCRVAHVDPMVDDLSGLSAEDLSAVAWRELCRPDGYRAAALDRVRTVIKSR